MREDEGRDRRDAAVLLAGWKLLAGIGNLFARVFLAKSPTAGVGNREVAGGGEEEEEKKRRRTGAALVVGGVLGWRAMAWAARLAARVFLTPGGARMLQSRAPLVLEKKSREEPVSTPAVNPEGPPGAAGLAAGAAVIGWEATKLAATTVAQALRGKADAVVLTRKQDRMKSDRAADENLDLGEGVNVERRERWGTVLVTTTFGAGGAAGIGFLFLYWTGGKNLLLGAMLAACCGGFGASLVLWSHWLMSHKEATDPREVFPSPQKQREEALEEFCAGRQDVQRRRLLQWMAGLGAGVFAAIVISLFRSLGFPPANALMTTVWRRGQRLVTMDGKPVRADSLVPGSTTIVFPEDSVGSEKAQTVLIRVHQDLLQLPRGRADWAPLGNLAYSRVCTHAGCAVGMYEATTHLLACPCHQSTFDVLRGAQPTGGPAARALPQLPLYADSQGVLRAAGGFTEPPGPGFWGMP